MNGQPFDTPPAPINEIRTVGSVSLGPYRGELSSVGSENLFMIEILPSLSGSSASLAGSVELPLDTLYRLKPGGRVTRCTYICDRDAERDLETEVSKLVRFGDGSIMEWGEIDSNGRSLLSMKLYSKPYDPKDAPYLSEGIIEDTDNGRGEVTYYKGRFIRGLSERIDSNSGKIYFREDSRYFGDIGFIYWLERYRQYGGRFKFLGGSKVFMEKPADIVMSRMIDDPRIVVEGDKKWYALTSEERAQNKVRLKELLEYRRKYFS